MNKYASGKKITHSLILSDTMSSEEEEEEEEEEEQEEEEESSESESEDDDEKTKKRQEPTNHPSNKKRQPNPLHKEGVHTRHPWFKQWLKDGRIIENLLPEQYPPGYDPRRVESECIKEIECLLLSSPLFAFLLPIPTNDSSLSLSQTQSTAPSGDRITRTFFRKVGESNSAWVL